VFEIAGDGSAYRDTVEKDAEYRATPSIQRYMVLYQARAGPPVFSRHGQAWEVEIVPGEGTLRTPEIRIGVPMSDIYKGPDLPPPEPPPVI